MRLREQFKYKEIIEVNNPLSNPDAASADYNKALKMLSPQEHLDNFYNWMSITVSSFNRHREKYLMQEVFVSISDLSKTYEHEINNKVFHRASFMITFDIEECMYEHPKWYRYHFYNFLLEPLKSHIEETVFTRPPGAKLNIGDGFEISQQFVEHINAPKGKVKFL